jgi:hypothetical protein
MLTVICRQNILRTITIKEVLILVTNILDQIVLKVKNYIAFIYYAKIVHLLCQFHAGKVGFSAVSSPRARGRIQSVIIMLTVICRQNILRTITIKEILILVTNILDQIVLKV